MKKSISITKKIMKKSDYITIGIMVILTSLGIYVGRFYGGFMAGCGVCALIVVTVGRISYNKAMKRQNRMDEAIRRVREMGKEMGD